MRCRKCQWRAILKTKHILVFALCALLGLGAAAYAGTGTSFYGPTGLIIMPTAETLGLGEANVFTNFASVDSADITPYGVNAGLGFGLEVGGTDTHVSNGGDADGFINAKWKAYDGNLVMPAVAVGAFNVTSNDGFTGDIAPYIVATKSLTIPSLATLSVSAGYLAGDVDKAMFGAKLGLTSKVDLIADYVPDLTDLSIAARYNMPSGFSLQAGAIDGDFTAGFTYTRALWSK
jgi:hypothetical protein